MSNSTKYKGFTGSVEFSESDDDYLALENAGNNRWQNLLTSLDMFTDDFLADDSLAQLRQTIGQLDEDIVFDRDQPMLADLPERELF